MIVVSLINSPLYSLIVWDRLLILLEVLLNNGIFEGGIINIIKDNEISYGKER